MKVNLVLEISLVKMTVSPRGVHLLPILVVVVTWGQLDLLILVLFKGHVIVVRVMATMLESSLFIG